MYSSNVVATADIVCTDTNTQNTSEPKEKITTDEDN